MCIQMSITIYSDLRITQKIINIDRHNNPNINRGTYVPACVPATHDAAKQRPTRRSRRPRGEAAALRARGEAASWRGKAARGKAAYNLVCIKLRCMQV